MSAAHVFAVGDRATVVGSHYDVEARTSHEIVLAIGTVTHARARVRLDTGDEYSQRGGTWCGYGGASGRLRPYQPGDEERLAERHAEQALDDARQRRKDAHRLVDAAEKDVERARKHLAEMEANARQAGADVAAAEARLADAGAAVVAIGGAS